MYALIWLLLLLFVMNVAHYIVFCAVTEHIMLFYVVYYLIELNKNDKLMIYAY